MSAPPAFTGVRLPQGLQGSQGVSNAPFNPNDPSLTREEHTLPDGKIVVSYANKSGKFVGAMVGDNIYDVSNMGLDIDSSFNPGNGEFIRTWKNSGGIIPLLESGAKNGTIPKTSTLAGDKDYGLGAGTEGILVTKRDANGSPLEYSVRTVGGGYTTTSDLTKATELASGYKDWYATQHPDQTRAAGIAAGEAGRAASPSWVAANPAKPTTADTTPAGTQTTPGVGEETQKKNASQYDQPSQAEQQWNGLAGKYNQGDKSWGDWSSSGLAEVYDRGQAKTQLALENRAAAGGYGGSTAAARATSNIGQDFTDRKALAQQDWAKTGMAQDAENRQRDTTGMGLAGSADTGKLNRFGQQMGEATTGQNLKLNRETGGLTSAIQIGQGLSGTTQGATNANNSETASLTTDITNLIMAKGAIGQADATAKAKATVDSLTAMGLTTIQIRAMLNPTSKGTTGATK